MCCEKVFSWIAPTLFNLVLWFNKSLLRTQFFFIINWSELNKSQWLINKKNVEDKLNLGPRKTYPFKLSINCDQIVSTSRFNENLMLQPRNPGVWGHNDPLPINTITTRYWRVDLLGLAVFKRFYSFCYNIWVTGVRHS